MEQSLGDAVSDGGDSLDIAGRCVLLGNAAGRVAVWRTRPGQGKRPLV